MFYRKKLMHESLLREKIYKRLLKEAGAINGGLGMCTYISKDGNTKKGTAYDISKLEMGLRDQSPLYEIIHDAIVASVHIIKPTQPCNGAWIVNGVAALPGYGGVAYGMGYHLAPNGTLIPDRPSTGSVSDAAQNAWLGVYNRTLGTPQEGIPLGDDCEKWDEELDHLNRSYSVKTGHDFNAMVDNHNKFLQTILNDSELRKKFNIPPGVALDLNKMKRIFGEPMFEQAEEFIGRNVQLRGQK